MDIISVESELGIGTSFYIYLPALKKVVQEMPELIETKIESTEKGINL